MARQIPFEGQVRFDRTYPPDPGGPKLRNEGPITAGKVNEIWRL